MAEELLETRIGYRGLSMRAHARSYRELGQDRIPQSRNGRRSDRIRRQDLAGWSDFDNHCHI